jgi:hypothetical protein
MRFSIQRALVAEVDAADLWRSEIEARMSLGEYASALALAQRTTIKEDRFHLLAIVARAQVEAGGIADPELMEQIRLLFDQIDLRALGDRALEIASELVQADPDLAIRIVEEATDTQADANALDRALTTLSMAALDTKANKMTFTNALEKTTAKIRDPKTQQFFSAASLLYGDCTADEIIAQVGKLESKNRLFYLRRWAVKPHLGADVEKVLQYALDTLIRNTTDTPTTRELRELATSITSIRDLAPIKELVGRFDSLRGSIEHLGTTTDSIRLSLLLALAEVRHDSAAAHHRVVEAYSSLASVKDLSVKAECLAWMVAYLDQIDPDKALELTDHLHGGAEDELQRAVNILLETTANQFEATQGVIRALASHKPSISHAIATRLNTRDRRNAALSLIVDVIVRAVPEQIDLALLDSVLNQFSDGEIRDTEFVQIMRSLATLNAATLSRTMPGLLRLVDAIPSITSGEDRCRACCFAFALLEKHGNPEHQSLSSGILHTLEESWDSIDPGWRRINIGFEIVRRLAVPSKTLAAKYLKQVEEAQRAIGFDEGSLAQAYLFCLRLAIRAFGGLLPRKIDTSEDLERLQQLIARVPSTGEAISLWATLALRCFMNGRMELTRDIVAKQVRPLLQELSAGDLWYKWTQVVAAAPALFYAHPTTAWDLIATLPLPQRDAAYTEICEFVLTKHPSSDPYNHIEGAGYALTYEESMDICEILSRMTIDTAIYQPLKNLSESVMARQNRSQFTSQQRVDIANRLEAIANSKFPDPNSILHHGYKVVTLAHVARLRSAADSVWTGLVSDANKIPNTADKAFVLSIVAVSLPAKATALRDKLLREALLISDSIPSEVDRISRILDLTEHFADIDMVLAKQCMRVIMDGLAKRSDSDSVHAIQRRLIDLANQIDPDFATSLASSLDDDPARAQARENFRRQLELHNTKKKLAEHAPVGTVDTKLLANYPQAAWMNLGALNAGRIEPLHGEYLRQHLEAAAQLPLRNAYPVLAWVIQNIVVRVSNTDQARSLLTPVFEATIMAAELAARLAIRTSIHSGTAKLFSNGDRTALGSFVVNPGERGKALDFIRDWCARNVGDYVKICDPFFGPEDLEILKLVSGAKAGCRITILTSRKRQQSVSQPWEDTYRAYWRRHVSEQDPPETDVLIVGSDSRGEPPIHERWFLAGASGLRIGTSLNSLGVTKISEVSELSAVEASMRENEVDQYLIHRKRHLGGERLRYASFSL